jgi:hypothetical protein
MNDNTADWKAHEDALERTVSLRELGRLMNRPLLPTQAAIAVRSARASGIAYRHYRIDLSGPHQGEQTLIEEWHPES